MLLSPLLLLLLLRSPLVRRIDFSSSPSSPSPPSSHGARSALLCSASAAAAAAAIKILTRIVVRAEWRACACVSVGCTFELCLFAALFVYDYSRIIPLLRLRLRLRLEEEEEEVQGR